MNVSLSDLYNSAAKSPEDKSEAETEDKTSEEKPAEEEKEPAEEKTEEGETEKKDEAATEEAATATAAAAGEPKKKFKLPNIPKALKNIRSKSKEREKNKVRNEVFCYSFRNYYCLKEKKC